MVIAVIVILISVSLISFILLVRFYLPLDEFLFSPREFLVRLDEIQFWVEKVSGRSYYWVDARYLKSPIGDSGEIATQKPNRYVAEAETDKLNW